MQKLMLDRRIVGEIGNKLTKLKEREGNIFYLLSTTSRTALEKEATLHSYKIENPEVLIDKSIAFKCHPSGRAVKKGINNLNDAFNWGVKNFDSQKLNKIYVEEIAKRINPELCPDGGKGYRNQRIIVSGRNEEGVFPSEIPGEMDLYCDNIKEMLNQNNLGFDLQAATYAHLHLARIHPFNDGNGRTARTLKNIILHKNGLPPVIIFGGERHDYFFHLRGAIDDWNSYGKHDFAQRPNTPTRENEFYNFIAGRVSASLDRMLGK